MQRLRDWVGAHPSAAAGPLTPPAASAGIPYEPPAGCFPSGFLGRRRAPRRVAGRGDARIRPGRALAEPAKRDAATASHSSPRGSPSVHAESKNRPIKAGTTTTVPGRHSGPRNRRLIPIEENLARRRASPHGHAGRITASPGTRSNSRTLNVRTPYPLTIAVAATIRSYEPIRLPVDSSSAQRWAIAPATSTSSGTIGIVARIAATVSDRFGGDLRCRRVRRRNATLPR